MVAGALTDLNVRLPGQGGVRVELKIAMVLVAQESKAPGIGLVWHLVYYMVYTSGNLKIPDGGSILKAHGLDCRKNDLLEGRICRRS